MVKCAIFALRAFLRHFNAFLLVGVVLLLCIGYQQVDEQPITVNGAAMMEAMVRKAFFMVLLCGCRSAPVTPGSVVLLRYAIVTGGGFCG